MSTRRKGRQPKDLEAKVTPTASGRVVVSSDELVKGREEDRKQVASVRVELGLFRKLLEEFGRRMGFPAERPKPRP